MLFANQELVFPNDSAQPFCCFRIFLHVHESRNHDPLCLGRPGPMHGFRQITYGARSKRLVFDEPQDTHAILRGNVAVGLEVLLKLSA